MTTTPHDKALEPCPFCGGEAAFEQTGKNELTLRCVGVQPSGLRGCGPKYVQKGGIRFTLAWLQRKMTENWNRRVPLPIAGKGDEGWQPISDAPKNQKLLVAYQNELGNWRIVTACYHTQLEWSDEYGDHEQEYAPEGWYEENDSSEVIYPTSRQPTHFRPLPAPPSRSEGGSDKP